MRGTGKAWVRMHFLPEAVQRGVSDGEQRDEPSHVEVLVSQASTS